MEVGRSINGLRQDFLAANFHFLAGICRGCEEALLTVHTALTSNAPDSDTWNVYLNGRLIDTVFFTPDCDADYVKRALVDHDGYNPAIVVRRNNRY